MGFPKSKLDRKRDARIRARLGEGYDVKQLCSAISGALNDPWLMGTDPKCKPGGYKGIETLLRDAAQVERLIELDDSASTPEPTEYDHDDPAWELEPAGVPMPKEFSDALVELTVKR
jgi:hypothetical protein